MPDESLDKSADQKQVRQIRIGSYSIPMPASRIARLSLGIVLIVGGLLGFLPVLGFWMIPLGAIVLSVDFAIVRRWRRRTEVAVGRSMQGLRRQANDDRRHH